jgi:hypothetical protein
MLSICVSKVLHGKDFCTSICICRSSAVEPEYNFAVREVSTGQVLSMVCYGSVTEIQV